MQVCVGEDILVDIPATLLARLPFFQPFIENQETCICLFQHEPDPEAAPDAEPHGSDFTYCPSSLNLTCLPQIVAFLQHQYVRHWFNFGLVWRYLGLPSGNQIPLADRQHFQRHFRIERFEAARACLAFRDLGIPHLYRGPQEFDWPTALSLEDKYYIGVIANCPVIPVASDVKRERALGFTFPLVQHAVVAGGSVVYWGAPKSQAYPSMDIDIFTFGSQAIEAAQAQVEVLLEHGFVVGYRGSSMAVAVKNCRMVQVIASSFETPEAVIKGFDLDYVMAYWLNHKIYVRPQALKAWLTMTVFTNFQTHKLLKPERLVKAQMKGFTLALDYDPKTVAAVNVETLYYNYVDTTQPIGRIRYQMMVIHQVTTFETRPWTTFSCWSTYAINLEDLERWLPFLQTWTNNIRGKLQTYVTMPFWLWTPPLLLCSQLLKRYSSKQFLMFNTVPEQTLFRLYLRKIYDAVHVNPNDRNYQNYNIPCKYFDKIECRENIHPSLQGYFKCRIQLYKSAAVRWKISAMIRCSPQEFHASLQ